MIYSKFFYKAVQMTQLRIPCLDQNVISLVARTASYNISKIQLLFRCCAMYNI